jgi:probable F420-dependent oxidoreductase
MAAEHDSLRRRLGAVGVWTFAFDARPMAQIALDAAEIEELGYGALWVPEGGGSRDVFAHLGWLLGATERITVCSGIANVTARHAETMRAGLVSLADAFGERVVLGIGIGHQYTSDRRGVGWGDPLARMSSYLDVMDQPSGLPEPGVRPARMLAALRDGMLRLAAERTLGAHTYFVPVEHTAHARQLLGPEPVLAVEQTAVLVEDADRARTIARGWTGSYLDLPNYARNWRRLGYGDEDLADGGSDRLVDAAIAWGDVDAVVARVRAHLDAGADHVCIQLISNDDSDVHLDRLRELSSLLLGATAGR